MAKSAPNLSSRGNHGTKKPDPWGTRSQFEPTNDVVKLLTDIGRRTGRLEKGGQPDLEATASWFIQQWQKGGLTKLMLDSIKETTLEDVNASSTAPDATPNHLISFSKARRMALVERKNEKRKVKRQQGL